MAARALDDFAPRDAVQGEQRVLPGQGDGKAIPPDGLLAQSLGETGQFGGYREPGIDPVTGKLVED
jgi:hypothetical protein